MARREVILAIFAGLLLSAILVFAQEEGTAYPYTILFVTFKDIKTDTMVSDLPATITFTSLDAGTKTTITRFLEGDGASRYQMRPGNWQLVLRADDQKTPETDYYTDYVFHIDESTFVVNKTIYVTPVGALEGVVIDKSQNRISGATLQFKCKSNIKIDYPEKSDEFGSFSVDVVPVGDCKVSAAYQGKVGVEDVRIDQGKVSTTTINLDKSLVTSGANIVYLSVGILLLLIVFVFFINRYLHLHLWKRKHGEKKKEREEKAEEVKEEKKEAEKQGEGTLNPRARDVMNTLKDTEKKVVEYLLAHEHSDTQAKIRTATGIPKTTLARTFTALEQKKVVIVEKFGRMKKVTLTAWFLGKE